MNLEAKLPYISNIPYYKKNMDTYEGAVLAEQIVKAIKGKSTPAGVAKGVYKAVCASAADAGLDPAKECFIRSPAENKAGGYGECWRVSWESGPYEWGLISCCDITGATGVLAEPYYSFDLCFYPG